MTTRATRTLLAAIVDYAGLFPPAGLTMAEAVREYAHWREMPESWMLARFVAPAGRLHELAQAVRRLPPAATQRGWRVSAVLDDPVEDHHRIAAFEAELGGHAFVVESVELRPPGGDPSEGAMEAALGAVVPRRETYVELPLGGGFDRALAPLARAGLRAKLRTGGLAADAIPDAPAVAAFVASCARSGVPFKATAGLHHPMRGRHPLGHGADGPSAVMHGFLNVFAAAVFAAGGSPQSEVVSVLCEEDPTAFELGDSDLAWRGLRASIEDVARTRATLACSFGSCSFDEPSAGLRALGLIP